MSLDDFDIIESTDNFLIDSCKYLTESLNSDPAHVRLCFNLGGAVATSYSNYQLNPFLGIVFAITAIPAAVGIYILDKRFQNKIAGNSEQQSKPIDLEKKALTTYNHSHNMTLLGLGMTLGSSIVDNPKYFLIAGAGTISIGLGSYTLRQITDRFLPKDKIF